MSIVGGVCIVLMGMRAIENGKFGYYNYLHQPITAQFAILIGIIFLVWPLIPKRVYHWVFDKLFSRMVSDVKKDWDKLNKKKQRKSETVAETYRNKLNSWRKW